MKTLTIISALVILMTTCVFAQPPMDSSGVTKLGQLDIWGGVGSVCVQGIYAYVGSPLRVINVQDPNNPIEVVSSYAMTMPFEVNDNYAYGQLGEETFAIVDISIPSSPALVGSYSCSGEGSIWGMAIEDNLAYLIVRDHPNFDLVILDISNPTDPDSIGHFFLADADEFHDIAVSNSYAYLIGDSLYVIDASSPQAPNLVDTLDIWGWGGALCLSGNLLYVASSVYPDSCRMSIFDVQNPAQVEPQGGCSTYGGEYGEATGIAAQGNYAYMTVSGGGNSLKVIYVQNPNAPVIQASYSTGGDALAIAVVDTIAYVGNYGNWGAALRIFDIAIPTSAFITGGIGLCGNEPHVNAVQGDYAYLVLESDGMCIIDIGDPTQPDTISFFASDEVEFLAVSGSYAFLSGENYLQVVNISNPNAPAQASQMMLPSGRLCVEGNVLYVAGDSLTTVNIAIPSNPQVLGRCDLPDLAYGIEVVGSYAYIAASDSGLVIVNVAIPSSPVVERRHDTPGTAEDVSVLDDIAYVADGDSGLRIFDVSPPSIVEIGHCLSTGEIWPGQIDTGYVYDVEAVPINGPHVFLADEILGLRVLWVSNPANPVEVGYYFWLGGESKVIYDGGTYAYYSGMFSFYVLDAAQAIPVAPEDMPAKPSAYSLSPAFPNPSNPQTSLAFSLPHAGFVTLSIYNLLGQEVARLQEGWMQAGNYRRTFDGSGLSSGIYLARLQAGEYVGVQKMVLLK